VVLLYLAKVLATVGVPLVPDEPLLPLVPLVPLDPEVPDVPLSGLIITPRNVNTFAVDCVNANKIGLETSPSFDGSVRVYAPEVAADKKYPLPGNNVGLRPVINPSITTSKLSPFIDLTTPNTSAFSGLFARALR